MNAAKLLPVGDPALIAPPPIGVSRRPLLVRIITMAVLLAAAIAIPYITSGYYVGIGSLILASAILASSVNMLAGDGGMVSLGHAGIAAAAGYGLAWSSKQGLELWMQLLIALALTLLASALFGLISMRTKGIFFLMVTLAAGMICYGIAFRWSAVTGGDNGLTGIRRPEAISAYWTFYFAVLVIFVICTAMLWMISRSPFGLVLRGIRDSESRMRSLGYPIAAYKFSAMMLSGFFAGVAGVLLVWHAEFISPSIGDFISSALALIMVVLGGLGTVSGPLVGAAVVILIQHVLSTYFDRWSTVLGLLFIASVIFAPKGLVGGFHSLTAWVGKRRAGRSTARAVPEEAVIQEAVPKQHKSEG
jgi:branched-chain amino acid transport system permease protein